MSLGEGVDVKDRFDVKLLSSLPPVGMERFENTWLSNVGEHLSEPGLHRFDHTQSERQLRCIEAAFRRSSKALLGQSGRLLCPSPAVFQRVGTLERLVLIARGAAKLIESTAPKKLDPRQSIEITCFILRRIREEVPRRVRLVLAHQGTRDFLEPKLGLSSKIFRKLADVCIDLDNVLLLIRLTFFPTITGVRRATRLSHNLC